MKFHKVMVTLANNNKGRAHLGGCKCVNPNQRRARGMALGRRLGRDLVGPMVGNQTDHNSTKSHHMANGSGHHLHHHPT